MLFPQFNESILELLTRAAVISPFVFFGDWCSKRFIHIYSKIFDEDDRLLIRVTFPVVTGLVGSAISIELQQAIINSINQYH